MGKSGTGNLDLKCSGSRLENWRYGRYLSVEVQEGLSVREHQLVGRLRHEANAQLEPAEVKDQESVSKRSKINCNQREDRGKVTADPWARDSALPSLRTEPESASGAGADAARHGRKMTERERYSNPYGILIVAN